MAVKLNPVMYLEHDAYVHEVDLVKTVKDGETKKFVPLEFSEYSALQNALDLAQCIFDRQGLSMPADASWRDTGTYHAPVGRQWQSERYTLTVLSVVSEPEITTIRLARGLK